MAYRKLKVCMCPLQNMEINYIKSRLYVQILHKTFFYYETFQFFGYKLCQCISGQDFSVFGSYSLTISGWVLIQSTSSAPGCPYLTGNNSPISIIEEKLMEWGFPIGKCPRGVSNLCYKFPKWIWVEELLSAGKGESA